MSAVPATWMRGGTSKCWVFRRADLDVPGRTLDATLLGLFGSPDPRQLDGVGGATSTTSKAVILSPSDRPDIDVEYTFAQVGIDEAKVDWGSNCGNCSAVVAPFAVREGWVTPTGRSTRVRVLNTNTGQVMVQDVRTRDGLLDETPTTTIPGVAVPGPRVDLGFVSPAGRTTGALLPTGSPLDTLTAGEVRVSATLVDAGAPVVVVDAAELGLTARETPAQLDARPDVLAALDAVRRAGAVAMGLAANPSLAERAVPKLAVVATPDAAEQAAGVHLVVRMLSMGRVHPALPITGSVALTLAAREEGTVVSRAAGGPTAVSDDFSMLTPAGVVTTSYSLEHGEPVVAAVRTYRRLVEGSIELPVAAAVTPELPRAIA
jgi:2-methylaconitate cis-trans-isomerase PrpF